nr:nucleotidyltransferase family protein [Methanosarcina acetivorans]
MEVIHQKFGVKRIGIFGSFARGEEKEDSDLDVLVVFEEGQKTFDNYMDLKFYLEDLFGREVDLVTEKALRPQLEDIIMKEVVYA